MNVTPIAVNQTEISLNGGVIIFFSYSTPVAAFVPGRGALVTNQFYSNTTSRHINKFVARHGASRVQVEQSEINALNA